jgi:hypothetical protein
VAVLARLVRIPAWGIALFLGAGVLLYVLDANEDNALVGVVMDVARFFADPFDSMFELTNNNIEIAINWGIAAVAYLIAGAVLARLLVAAGASVRSAGRGIRRRRAT